MEQQEQVTLKVEELCYADMLGHWRKLVYRSAHLETPGMVRGWQNATDVYTRRFRFDRVEKWNDQAGEQGRITATDRRREINILSPANGSPGDRTLTANPKTLERKTMEPLEHRIGKTKILLKKTLNKLPVNSETFNEIKQVIWHVEKIIKSLPRPHPNAQPSLEAQRLLNLCRSDIAKFLRKEYYLDGGSFRYTSWGKQIEEFLNRLNTIQELLEKKPVTQKPASPSIETLEIEVNQTGLQHLHGFLTGWKERLIKGEGSPEMMTIRKLQFWIDALEGPLDFGFSPEGATATSTPHLVLHEMKIWEVKKEGDEAIEKLFDGYFNRAGVDIENDTFPLSMAGIRYSNEFSAILDSFMQNSPMADPGQLRIVRREAFKRWGRGMHLLSQGDYVEASKIKDKFRFFVFEINDTVRQIKSIKVQDVNIFEVKEDETAGSQPYSSAV